MMDIGCVAQKLDTGIPRYTTKVCGWGGEAAPLRPFSRMYLQIFCIIECFKYLQDSL